MRISDLINGKWVKYPKPILRPGLGGEWDDALAGTPRICKKAKNKYYLFYTGQNHKSGIWGIGIAESSSLFDWRKLSINPILSGTKGAWDERIDGANIFRYKNNYYLFYEGSGGLTVTQNPLVKLLPLELRFVVGRFLRNLFSSKYSLGIEHAGHRAIGYATSPDLMIWTKFENNPVFRTNEQVEWESEGVYSPCIGFIDGQFYMTYAGSNGVRVESGLATSMNLKAWKRFKYNPILKTGPKGSWDERIANATCFVKLEDGFCLFYEGEDEQNNYRIGYAHSYDFKHWEKFRQNPILDIGKKGSFDERMVCGPQVFIENNKFYMFYVGQNEKMQGCSGLAFFSKK